MNSYRPPCSIIISSPQLSFHSLPLFFPLIPQSSGPAIPAAMPVLFVPGSDADLISLSSWLTRRDGYVVVRPWNTFASEIGAGGGGGGGGAIDLLLTPLLPVVAVVAIVPVAPVVPIPPPIVAAPPIVPVLPVLLTPPIPAPTPLRTPPPAFASLTVPGRMPGVPGVPTLLAAAGSGIMPATAAGSPSERKYGWPMACLAVSRF